jgi:hypothetical protein
MKWSRPSRLLLLIFWGFWATAGIHAFALGAAGNGTATISAGQGFGPKLQYGGGFTVDLVFPLSSVMALDWSVGGFTVAPSDISGGFLYRGYSGGNMALMAVFLPAIFSTSDFGVLRLGGGAGLAAALPSYWYTTLAFFYLEPRVEGLLAWTPAGLSRFTFQLSLPVAMQLRRDMSYSFSAALGLGVLYTFKEARR